MSEKPDETTQEFAQTTQTTRQATQSKGETTQIEGEVTEKLTASNRKPAEPTTKWVACVV